MSSRRDSSRPQRESSRRCLQDLVSDSGLNQDPSEGESISSIDDLLVSSDSEEDAAGPTKVIAADVTPSLAVKKGRGNTIIIPIKIMKESDDSDIEVVAEVALERLQCNFCATDSFPSKLSYREHLSILHFKDELIAQFKTERGSLVCPECRQRFNNKLEAAKHLGMEHEQVSRIIEERNLKINCSRRRGPHPSLNTSGKMEEEEMDEIIVVDVEDEEEECMFCQKSYPCKLSLDKHLVHSHITPRMEQELERAGWEAGQKVCPECRSTEADIVLHWGLQHGGVQRATAKLKGEGEHLVLMKSAQQDLNKWVNRRTQKLKVDLPNSERLRHFSTVILQEKRRFEESIGLDMEVDTSDEASSSDEVEDKEMVEIQSESKDKGESLGVENKKKDKMADAGSNLDEETQEDAVTEIVNKVSFGGSNIDEETQEAVVVEIGSNDLDMKAGSNKEDETPRAAIASKDEGIDTGSKKDDEPSTDVVAATMEEGLEHEILEAEENNSSGFTRDIDRRTEEDVEETNAQANCIETTPGNGVKRQEIIAREMDDDDANKFLLAEENKAVNRLDKKSDAESLPDDKLDEPTGEAQLEEQSTPERYLSGVKESKPPGLLKLPTAVETAAAGSKLVSCEPRPVLLEYKTSGAGVVHGGSTQHATAHIKKEILPVNQNMSMRNRMKVDNAATNEGQEDTEDEIQVIYEPAPSKDARAPVRGHRIPRKSFNLELGSMAQDFILGQVPKSRSLDNIERKMERIPRKEMSRNATKSSDNEIKILSELHRSSEPPSSAAANPAFVETCKICQIHFATVTDFYLHLTRQHFKEALQKRLYSDNSTYSHGEWKCPTCHVFVSGDIDVMIDHYGAYCVPVPVKSLYLDHTMKTKERKPDMCCVFCDDSVDPKELISHISLKHSHEVKYKMGMVWSFHVSGSVEMSCPICLRVEPFATNGLVEHFLRDHSKEFRISLENYKAAIKESSMVDCPICGNRFLSPQDCLEHLVLNHFKDQLFSECGLSQDREFACSNCEYKCTKQKEIVLHYGIEHQRLNFCFTERVLNMAAQKAIIIEDPLKKEKLEPGEYLKLAQFLSSEAGLREELSAREFLLNGPNPVATKCRNLFRKTVDGEFQCVICDLTLKSEVLMLSHIAARPHQFAKDFAGMMVVEETRRLWCKICFKQCSTKEDFQRHLADKHFMDDILLEARRQERATESGRGMLYFCEECPQVGYLSNLDMIHHRNKKHGAALRLYKRVQVTPPLLRCRLCPPQSVVFQSLAAFKYHLGTHFRLEMESCLRTIGPNLVCLLCDEVICPAHTHYDTARHVGVRHNYLEQLYNEEVGRGTIRPELFACELCSFPPCHSVPEFLRHLTQSHMEPYYAPLHQELLGCPTCGVEFPHGYLLRHIGEEQSQCNLSLHRYYQLVDQARHPGQGRLPFNQYRDRLIRTSQLARAQGRKPPDIYPSQYILPRGTPDFIEDPVSCEIKLEPSPYEGYMTVEFLTKLPMKSFKSSRKFEKQDDVPTCALCPLFRGHWYAPEGDPRAVTDAFLIHLANTHFKTELEKMFAARRSSAAGDFECCEETFNYQTLIGHVKEQHSVILNMYRAVVPIEYPSLSFTSRQKVVDPQYVSYLMPWLPKSFNQIKRPVVRDTGMDCKLCNQRIPGAKKDLNRHYVLAHFQEELEVRYSESTRAQPYRCPEFSCKYVCHNLFTTQKEELFTHLANKHKVVDQLLLSCFSNSHKFEQHSNLAAVSPAALQFIKSGVSIKVERERVELLPITAYISPQPFQCLQCHKDMGNPFNLAMHMSNAKHVNISWALQTNQTGKEERHSSSRSGVWFQKLDLHYRCSQCVKKATLSMSISKFFSLEEVFVHIAQYHKDFFQAKYPETVASFCICKLCNGFIDLQGEEDEEGRQEVEYNHYMSHGSVFILQMGMLRRTEANLHLCVLCNQIFRSRDTFNAHLKAAHRGQVLSSFRDFTMPSHLVAVKHCCICKQPDPSLDHLSCHSKNILTDMGLIQSHIKDHKSSRITCRCCSFTDKNSTKIIEHFAAAHKDLFEFVRLEFDKQNGPLDMDRGVAVKTEKVQQTVVFGGVKQQQSLLKTNVRGELSRFHYTCSSCTLTFDCNPQLLRSHLVNKHYFTEILEHVTELVKSKNICPECGECSDQLSLHYWIQHLLKKDLITVDEPTFDGENLVCKLCNKKVGSLFHYYSHVYWIHTDDQSRKSVTLQLEQEQAKNFFSFCPEAGCQARTASDKELVLHYATKHNYLETYLASIGKTKELELKDRSFDPQISMAIVKTEPLESEKDDQTDDWKMTPNCQICSKSMLKRSLFERKTHYLDHLRPDFQEHMRVKMSSSKLKCELCSVTFKDEQTSFMHFGTEHGLFNLFIKERRKKAGFSNEYSRFLDGRSKAPLGRMTSLAQQKSSPTFKKVVEGEKCKLCEMVFGKNNRQGESRSDSSVSNERFTHYLSHFRDKLISKHPKSFSNTMPLKCGKCPYYTSQIKSIKQEDHKRNILQHIARCKNELEELIQECKPRISVCLSIQPYVPEKTEDWEKVDHCIICHESKGMVDGEKRTHYSRHFVEELFIICKDIFAKNNLDLTIVCPFPNCKVQILRNDVSRDDFILQFFQHIGFYHNLIPELFLSTQKFIVESNTLDKVKASLMDRFWAIKAGNCVVCATSLSVKNRQERSQHYFEHFQCFSSNLSFDSCFKCKYKPSSVEDLKMHLLNQHFNRSLSKNIKLREDGDFQCAHCKFISDKTKDILCHLINVEMYLDIEIMADIEKKNLPKVVEVVKAEEAKDPSNDLAGEQFDECKICKRWVKKKFFVKHLHRQHFKQEIDAKINKYFRSLPEETGLQVKCKVCSVMVSNNDAANHIASDHEEVNKLYSITTKEQSNEGMKDDLNFDNCTELTTLGEDIEDTEEAEKEMKQYLKSMEQSQECFIQNAPCYMYPSKLPPCHECKKIQQGANYALSGTCCCFEGFRKVRFLEDGKLIVVGYLDPGKDPRTTDLDIWVPKTEALVDLSIDEAFFILQKVGDLLCDVIVDERLMKEEYISSNRFVVWKRPHQGVREMCDVCSTSIYNLHFTCSRCGVLVCCDCFLARKRGTKYKSMNAITKPTRTRKRFRSGLDINLWPLCLNDQIHDIDKLIMTQMSPENVPEDLCNDIHSIKKFYRLDAKCKCCVTANMMSQNESKVELDPTVSVGVFQACPDCGTSFSNVTLCFKQIHMAHHMKDSILQNTKGFLCTECGMEARTKANYLAHKALVHRVADEYYGNKLIEEESKRQKEVNLVLDNDSSCKICRKGFTEQHLDSKRSHYLYHLAETILTNIKPVPPFSCEECNHIELNRNRLMLHMAFYHKHIDAALEKYLTEDGNTSNKALSSWLDIPNCVYCKWKFDNLTPSQKRHHYILNHLKSALEKAINEEFDNILERSTPYRCRKQGCMFVVDSSNPKTRFLIHMGATHKMIDTFIVDVTRTMIQIQNSDPVADLLGMFSGKCQLCDEEFDSSDSPSALKAAKAHYQIHFKDSIEEKYEDVFAEHKIPIQCPYEGCQFNTEDFESDQFGHHKKKLIKHLGSFHDLFKNFVTQGTSSKKNYEMSYRFSTDQECKICRTTLPEDFEKKKLHFYQHFRNEIEREFEKEIYSDPMFQQLNCPFCDTHSSDKNKSEAFKAIAVHMGVNHGVFDKKIDDYSRNLDYGKETSCRVCGKDFTSGLAKVASLKKHYAEHFGETILREFPDLNDKGICPFCSKPIITRESQIIHVGTHHGYFCRLIEKHHWKEEEDEVVEEVLNESIKPPVAYSLLSEGAQSLCAICGCIVTLGLNGKEDLSIEQSLQLHFLSHVDYLIPGMEKLTCLVCNCVFVDKTELLKHHVSHNNAAIYCENIFTAGKVDSTKEVMDFFMAIDSEYVHPRYLEVSSLEDNMLSVPVHEMLTSCPMCKCLFSSVDNTTVKLHLLRHLVSPLLEQIPAGQELNCQLCSLELKNKFSQVIHYGVSHNFVDKVTIQELKDVKQSKEAKVRTDKSKIIRYTLPKNSDRYKSICLLCGSDEVRLASVDRLKIQSQLSPEHILALGPGVHIVKKHLIEFFPFLTNSKRNCESCNENFKHHEALIEHFVSDHKKEVIHILKNIVFGIHAEIEDLTYFDFFVGFENPGYFDTAVLEIEKLAPSKEMLTTLQQIPPVNANITEVILQGPALKRKTGDLDFGIKRIKQEVKVKFDKSVRCDICDCHISAKKHAEHVLKHVKQDISHKYVMTDSKIPTLKMCSICNQTSYDENALVRHIGIDHNHAESLYKKLEVHKLTLKKRQFHDQLNKSVPSECRVCEKKIVKVIGPLHDTYWKHLVQDHGQLFDFLKVSECEECCIQISSSNPMLSTFYHHMIEHNDSVEGLLKDVHVKEWQTIGNPFCELCGTVKVYNTPHQKKLHLTETHFRSVLLEQVSRFERKYHCPIEECKYVSDFDSDILVHYGITHKIVEKLLSKQLILSHRMKPVEAVSCAMCPMPVNCSDANIHILTHFFTTFMVSNISSTDCQYLGCTTEFNKVAKPAYGHVLHHMGEHHLDLILQKFLDSSILTMAGSPVRAYELQCMILQLLRSQICIICTKPLIGDVQVHFAEHFFSSVCNPEEDQYECDFCDGFPCFDSFTSLQQHQFREHFNLQQELKSLVSVLKIEELRQTVINQNKIGEMSKSLLGKRRYNSEEEEDCQDIPKKASSCHIVGCSGYQSNNFCQHFTNHFWELIIRDLVAERLDKNVLSCPRCDFVGCTLEVLVYHYGEYHQVTQFYVKLSLPGASAASLPGASAASLPGASAASLPGTSAASLPVPRKECLLCLRPREPLDCLFSQESSICCVCTQQLGPKLDTLANLAQFHPKVPGSSDCGSTNPRVIQEDKILWNPLASVMKTLIDNEDKDLGGEEKNPPLGLRANILTTLKEDDQRPGVSNDHPARECVEEPGLTTLSPRHILTMQESRRISAEAAHTWLCDGRLLHLHDAVSPHNNELFKQQWARGQPVLISNSDQYLNKRLWTPKAFLRDFEDFSADLVNTLTGKTVPKQPLKWFWEGFSSVSQRLVDAEGTPMLLKLKDWPPDGDIAENLPKRYHDLIHDFPIQSYTLREGKLNLASYMPDYFLKPELGPKMYIAYGNALYSERASTNLHLDMSDAVNLLVYVGLPDDCNPAENIRVVLEQVDEAGCDVIMRRRVRDEGLLPGAIWHIFHPGDTNKIRDLLLKVALEKGKRLDPHDDPIHDQSTYLDSRLRVRLYQEYGVLGYTIVQCAGDTVFVPAGACHQVRNLHNCIKIAEDFVSPELANNCLHLTQEFRHLTEHHTNHEDKLQIKNIIYHSVKTAVGRIKTQMERDKQERVAVKQSGGMEM